MEVGTYDGNRVRVNKQTCPHSRPSLSSFQDPASASLRDDDDDNETDDERNDESGM